MTQAEIDETDLPDIVDLWIGQEAKGTFEGEAGVRKLNKLANALGYDEDGFAYGSSLERFLQDNPGCIETMIEWIRNNGTEDWKENLASDLVIDEEEEKTDA